MRLFTQTHNVHATSISRDLVTGLDPTFINQERTNGIQTVKLLAFVDEKGNRKSHSQNQSNTLAAFYLLTARFEMCDCEMNRGKRRRTQNHVADQHYGSDSFSKFQQIKPKSEEICDGHVETVPPSHRTKSSQENRR